MRWQWYEFHFLVNAIISLFHKKQNFIAWYFGRSAEETAVTHILQISFEEVWSQRVCVHVCDIPIRELLTTLESDLCDKIYFLEEFITNNIMKNVLFIYNCNRNLEMDNLG